MSYPETLIWGTGAPKFSLLQGLDADFKWQKVQLPGTANWTLADSNVVTSADLTSCLAADQQISNAEGGNKCYTVLSVAANLVVLTSNFLEASDPGGEIWRNIDQNDGRIISLPDCVDTHLEFIPERQDGGTVSLTLSDGTFRQRVEGYRPVVTFVWTALSRTDLLDLLTILNHTIIGRVEVQPHDDVAMKFIMTCPDALRSGYTGNLFLAHDATVRFVGEELLSSIPKASAAGEFSPLIF